MHSGRSTVSVSALSRFCLTDNRHAECRQQALSFGRAFGQRLARVGEARVPGPSSAVADVVITTWNITSLYTALQVLQAHGSDAYVVQEHGIVPEKLKVAQAMSGSVGYAFAGANADSSG
eukprot:11602716-Alexandrium_andersonii.AAC.1